MKRNIFFTLSLVFSVLLFASTVIATTSLTYQYDANGNLISGDGKYYEYNDANQLIRVRHGDQNGPVIAEYFYDYTGQRIKKIENGVTTYYIGKHFETQVDGESQTNTSYYFANGERVAKKDQSGNVYFYHLDHLVGTNVITDSDGSLIERIKYYPFGEIREGGNEKYSFTGKEKDKLTDFYYFEARYYNPEFKHFTQADIATPDLYTPQMLNRYAYVLNNPLKFVDPNGKNPLLAIVGLTVIAVGLVSPIIATLRDPGIDNSEVNELARWKQIDTFDQNVNQLQGTGGTESPGFPSMPVKNLYASTSYSLSNSYARNVYKKEGIKGVRREINEIRDRHPEYRNEMDILFHPNVNSDRFGKISLPERDYCSSVCSAACANNFAKVADENRPGPTIENLKKLNRYGLPETYLRER